ncbi:Neural-cadherin-like 20, partial [Homarus americanus]
VCVDDLRVCGKRLPLPPAVNGTVWGQVTTLKGLDGGCDPPDPCARTSCRPPLTCTTSWGQPICSCGPGRQLAAHTCTDINECTAYQPCLNGGTCVDHQPGYTCVCGPGHTGANCEWSTMATPGHPLAAPLAMAFLTVSLFLFVVLGVLVTTRLRRRCSLHRHASTDLHRGQEEEQEAGAFATIERKKEVGGGGVEGGGGRKRKRKKTSITALEMKTIPGGGDDREGWGGEEEEEEGGGGGGRERKKRRRRTSLSPPGGERAILEEQDAPQRTFIGLRSVPHKRDPPQKT